MIDQIVEKYIALRDKKAQFKAEYEAKVAEIEAALDRIEKHLLEKMQEQGLKSLPTPMGTAYIQHRTSASVAEVWSSSADVHQFEHTARLRLHGHVVHVVPRVRADDASDGHDGAADDLLASSGDGHGAVLIEVCFSDSHWRLLVGCKLQLHPAPLR
jgi:hypothetical protein